MKSTHDFDNIEAGLAQRGFVGMEGMDSMGQCHKNEQHWILRTDGLIIYTTYPWTHRKPEAKDFKEYWGMDEFSFDKLDEVMNIVECKYG